MSNKQKFSRIFFFIVFSVILSFTSCSKDKFKVKGEIYGGEDKSIVLEKSDYMGQWIPLDSVKINRNGGFSFAFPAPGAPEIYRLALNGQYIYLPVDSTETITVNSSFDKFGKDFSLAGSDNAERMAQFEKELQTTQTASQDDLAKFKREVFTKYMKDFPGSIVSFYVLTKSVDGKPLYNPSDPIDRKYFGAVATGYKTMRPDDPRAALLEQTAINAFKQKNAEQGNYTTYEAEEISLIDIDRPDETGNNVKLSDVVGKGKPVVVIFSLLNHQDSPELNIALNQIYNRLNGKVEFYNVSLDADQYQWRESARNLPWITVYSPGESISTDAINYNVFQVPSFFIYNSEGELTSRPMTVEELNKSL